MFRFQSSVLSVMAVVYIFAKPTDNMKTKIRLFTIIFSAIMLGAFSLVPYISYRQNQLFEGDFDSNLAIALMVLVLAGLIVIQRLTLIVEVEPEISRITFNYPFRFKRVSFHFKEIFGFRYSYIPAKFNDYKVLQVKTKSGETFAFSDFETSNLRDFENFFLLHFDLRRGRSFDELSELEKKREIQKSKSFDIEQAKDIRFYLYLLIAVCIFMISVVIGKILDNGLDLTPISLSGILILTIILTLSIKQLRVVYKTLRGGNP